MNEKRKYEDKKNRNSGCHKNTEQIKKEKTTKHTQINQQNKG